MSVINQVNEPFANGVGNQNYRPVKKSAWYDEDVANELSKMTKKTAV